MVAVTKALFFAASVSAASLVNRDAAKVQSDLNTINSATSKLTSDTNSYTGGTIAALPIANDATSLDNDIKSATTDVNNAGTVTAQQAGSILSYITGTLTPNVQSALNAIIAKKSQFTSANLKSTVQSQLTSLHTDTDALSGALVAKAPSASQAAASSASSAIDALFTSAIAAFQ